MSIILVETAVQVTFVRMDDPLEELAKAARDRAARPSSRPPLPQPPAQLPPYAQHSQPQQVVYYVNAQKWSPGVAGLLSFLIPGAGHIYKGQVGFGIMWFFLTAIGYVLLVIPGVVLHIVGIFLAASGNPNRP